ncbi:hypothetical protein KW541_22220 [Vibrio fluvialis]|nr:hypothetical protein [Vibrio fluvialis]MBY8212353.1 hypothetical protein [Vibrio fluvialis]
MKKKERIDVFDARMKDQAPVECPKLAWELLSSVLKSVEDDYAPQGEEKMTILSLNHKDVKKYGDGGYAIPLIGYVVYLNPNGAIQIESSYNHGLPSVELPGADGKPFQKIEGWSYHNA